MEIPIYTIDLSIYTIDLFWLYPLLQAPTTVADTSLGRPLVCLHPAPTLSPYIASPTSCNFYYLSSEFVY